MICVRSLALLENHIAYLRASVRIHAQRFLSNPAPLRLLAFVFFPQHFSPSHPACPGSPLIQAKGFSFYCSRPSLWVVPQCPSNVLLLFPPPLSFSCLAVSSYLAAGFWLCSECTTLPAWCCVFFPEHFHVASKHIFFSMHLARPVLIVHQQFSAHLAQAESAPQSKCKNNNVQP